jgi:hypothetical protein
MSPWIAMHLRSPAYPAPDDVEESVVRRRFVRASHLSLRRSGEASPLADCHAVGVEERMFAFPHGGGGCTECSVE